MHQPHRLPLAVMLGLLGTACGSPRTAAGPPFPGAGLLATSGQQVVVVVDSDGDSTGVLYRVERSGTDWRVLDGAIPVNVGAGGVAKTREGDKRAPTGAYPLTRVFGYAPAPPAGLRMPYLPLTPETECVDDAESAQYNRVVNPSSLPGGRTWTSSEMMRRDLANHDDLYKLGILVDYNPAGARDPATGKGAGSCIFLHIWRGPARPTVGCTSMPEDALRALVAWLDPARAPILVQGTRADLARLRAAGTLPYDPPAGT